MYYVESHGQNFNYRRPKELEPFQPVKMNIYQRVQNKHQLKTRMGLQ